MISAKNLISRTSELSILYVEDEEHLRQNTEKLLSNFFKEVISAKNGQEALQKFQSRDFDLILTDLRMPVMDGVTFCQTIKELDFDQPIIVISAHDEVEYLLELINLGVDSFLVKPLDLSKFLAVMHKVCGYINQKKALHEAELKRAQLTLALQKSNAQKDRFFSIIAHDLRSPFNGLMGMTALLENNLEQLPTKDAQEFAGDVHRSAVKFYNLLENLLEWGRLQQGIIERNPQAVDLELLIQEVFEGLELVAREKKIDLKILPSEVALIWVDRNMIRSVIHNLITNALKFSFPGTAVQLSWKQQTNQINLLVQDKGVGMSEKVQQKILQLDQHHTTSGTAGEPGTGLGLVLCKEMMEQNQGTITLSSKEGEGTSFSLLFPMPKEKH